MKKLLLISLMVSFALVGCTVDQMAKVNTKQSMFDGTKMSSTMPLGTLGSSKWAASNVLMGATWLHKAPKFVSIDVVLMYRYENLGKLQFNIDGQIIEARPINQFTDLKYNGSYKTSSQSYLIPADAARLIVKSNNTVFKLHTLSGGSIEGAIVLNGQKALAYKSISNIVDQI